MLVLSRKSMESILISDDITVTILSVQGNKVRLGVQAPRTIPVHRTEVREAISGQHSGPPACSPQLPTTLTPTRAGPLESKGEQT